MKKKPIVYDLGCWLGGWAEGFLAEGYKVIGYDIHPFPTYPGKLILKSVLDIDGRDLRDGTVIVASMPCTEFSRHQMPWTKRHNPPPPDLSLIKACFRIAHQAHLPIVLENVRMAQHWLGKTKAHYGSQYLWGDVPEILPEVHFGPDKGPTPPGYQRQKQTLPSSARVLRAKIPFPLARHIARCFYPGHPFNALIPQTPSIPPFHSFA